MYIKIFFIMYVNEFYKCMYLTYPSMPLKKKEKKRILVCIWQSSLSYALLHFYENESLRLFNVNDNLQCENFGKDSTR